MQALLPRRVRKAIGMTALIDVVFILLMFFMLTSTFVRQGFVAMNSQAASAGTSAQSESRYVVLHPDGSLSASIASQSFALSDPGVQDLISAGEALVVSPIRSTRLQTIVSSLTTLGEMGPSRISLGESVGPEKLAANQ